MRKFLLTWYGITDFRASLGFENTDGPIAGALATEDYSDVVILCYTRPDNDSSECVEAQSSFAAELASIRDADQEKDWETTGEFVSRFANTTAAHRHFVHWLKSKVSSADSSTRIWFKSEKLRELNDTEGIYACATRALDFVAKEAGEKLVTLYLSPGTPVMAFVWALVALEHPELKKRLVASPVIGKPPETVSLPTEWLERYGANQDATRDAANGFDVTFHLFGEQRMPALLGIRQFESKRHIFVNSKEYPAVCMRAFIDGGEFDELPVDPWDARAVRKQIVRTAEGLPANSRIGINLTGGTKLMFAGALSAARTLGAVPFYFDSRNNRVTFVDSLRNASIRPIESVDTFLLLNGDGLKLSKDGGMQEFSPDRRLLTETLWKHRGPLASHYRELCKISDQHEKLRKSDASVSPFKIQCNDFVFELDKNKVATVVGGGLDLRFENQLGFAKYLSGGWFEEYVYLQCKPYEDAGVIKDLRINVELRLDREKAGNRHHWNASYNELDIVFTDGHSLYIGECKAGNVTQEQVMKLQNLVRFYGGVEGHGIVACCFPPGTESVRKKIKDARLSLCCGDSFFDQLKALMDGIAARIAAIGESL
ncbi:Card1-like endonuclease domain-containing protein [Caballeronia sp. SBC2]|uniref:Card1-like endonuclease domain-containing protein n=1 Tax=Caballeronia sp. SBC2 TaxID=2705547 RepID=UPI0013E123F3|nr:DUF1887 family CARF protein [Caballeronia sp. SBC2]QIE30198.1 hypothetical protein SBC2_82740 [Caballeronia sp. SBC2]